eukprot:1178772-Prorocentrum_minimum.AAC.3
MLPPEDPPGMPWPPGEGPRAEPVHGAPGANGGAAQGHRGPEFSNFGEESDESGCSREDGDGGTRGVRDKRPGLFFTDLPPQRVCACCQLRRLPLRLQQLRASPRTRLFAGARAPLRSPGAPRLPPPLRLAPAAGLRPDQGRKDVPKADTDGIVRAGQGVRCASKVHSIEYTVYLGII